MITVACVNVGNYEQRGAEYVEKLHAMVDRHLHAPFQFVCIKKSERAGWWAKVDLFEPGRFTGRVVYFDLDTVIVDQIDALSMSRGILHLADWGWTRNDYGSGVMVWDAGEHADIWEKFTADVPDKFRGDQDYLTALGGWPALPKGSCVSYRYVSVAGPPVGASVVCMHGKPKPHELPADSWVHEHWRA